NDVWVVQRPKKKDVLLPYIDSVVKTVDLENGVIYVEIPEGLIDDEN
ncbi:MAG: ribosome maturation factor RimM, partial [Enterococcus hirae]|nr:ribosome maturation factor RimM [Enterococcus hirae]